MNSRRRVHDSFGEPLSEVIIHPVSITTRTVQCELSYKTLRNSQRYPSLPSGVVRGAPDDRQLCVRLTLGDRLMSPKQTILRTMAYDTDSSDVRLQ